MNEALGMYTIEQYRKMSIQQLESEKRLLEARVQFALRRPMYDMKITSQKSLDLIAQVIRERKNLTDSV